MANELQSIGPGTGRTCYFLIRNRTGAIWSTVTSAFVTYATVDYANYDVAATEQGSASNYYVADFPAAIAAGYYNIVCKQQLAGAPAETDPNVSQGIEHWNGTALAPLSDLATSGQIGQIAPLRLARGVQVLNFPVYLRSSADHVSPLTSGVVSGQIARDGGSFGALQSGAFTETGLGWYNLQALTSGDILANTIKLHFTANGISGGSADPVPMSFVLQRVSGQT